MPFTSFHVRNFSSLIRAAGIVFRQRRSIGMRVINKTGSSIAANVPVTISGYDVTTALPKIVLADSDAAGLHTDVYITRAAIADGKKADVFKGFMSTPNMNTSGATTVGDGVFLGATPGALVFTTAPTGATVNQMILGYVQVKSATVGQIAWDVQPSTKFGSGDQNA